MIVDSTPTNRNRGTHENEKIYQPRPTECINLMCRTLITFTPPPPTHTHENEKCCQKSFDLLKRVSAVQVLLLEFYVTFMSIRFNVLLHCCCLLIFLHSRFML